VIRYNDCSGGANTLNDRQDNGPTKVLHLQCLHDLGPKRAAFSNERPLARWKTVAWLICTSPLICGRLDGVGKADSVPPVLIRAPPPAITPIPDITPDVLAGERFLQEIQCGRDEKARRQSSAPLRSSPADGFNRSPKNR
jgi:hypothetical protein